MDKLKQLLEKASDTDKVELKIHHNATISCLKAYNENPGAARKKDLTAAREGLAETINRLWPVYFQDDERFPTVKEALGFLKGKGYKIAQSKFYKDCKPDNNQPAMVSRQPDGSFLTKDLLLYAKTLPFVGDPAAGMDKQFQKKLKLEIQRLQKQNKTMEFDLKVKQSKFVPRDEAEQHHAATISIIEANIKNFHLTAAPEIIHMVKGDGGQVGALVEFLGARMDEFFNALAKTETIKIQFE